MDFTALLINWYLQNKRDLPWRNTKNPYFIWLSEIILQQTRVDQGLPYYLNFIVKYPTINELADAKEDNILKLWQGLGYYSRARNLHFTAKTIKNDLDGVFPNNYENLKKLKGVGDYTAAAIASFAFDLPYPVVDGNVFRFLSRVFSINTPIDSLKGKKEFLELASELIDKKQPALFNQAVMEFGATICLPKLPLCNSCPFSENCLALKNNSIGLLPFKNKKIKQKPRYFNYLYIKYNNHIYMQKRTDNDIWQNLYEFPLIESVVREQPSGILKNSLLKEIAGNSWECKNVSIEYKHVLSHQIIYATFYEIEITGFKKTEKNSKYIRIQSFKQHAIPRLIDKYLKNKDNSTT
ncbi:MAG: A/G-specific adenine glycosylase [Bacteroidota bacterium]|nr:A/G-specific adenine glycosylase [Bacteroidota bacterium]